MADRSRQRSPLAMVVLSLLAEAPMHAYRMHELIKQRAKDSVVNVAQRNSVYQTIARLLRSELIRVQTTARDDGRPERVVYEITEEGGEALQDWLKAMLSSPTAEFPEFPAALAFLPVLSPEEVQRQLEARVTVLEGQLAQISAGMKGALAGGLPRLFLVEDEYRQTMLQAELGWVRALIDELRAKTITWSPAWLREIAAAFAGGEKP
ncbi:PadR family transcriptional regulator [Andreprevotia chitinilytica]|uniref:PadR family transcriptional regulator n=1 Tax=Andreprevotia chitinilytica TaxID=396808 RepID=UPI00054EAF02|nr:PadR family transcriptional regulator [Andreprevotia chitinilytica]